MARIPVSNLTLPKCDKNEDEGKYNEKVSKTDQEFCLMDKRLVAVNGGSKKSKHVIYLRPRSNLFM